MILKTGDRVLYVGKEQFSGVNLQRGTIAIFSGGPTILIYLNNNTFTIGDVKVGGQFIAHAFIPIKSMSKLEKVIYGI